MTINHYQLFRKLIKIYPLKLQAPWDKSKFLCPKNNWKTTTKRVFIMLDCEYDWFITQKFSEHDFLIIHHPLIFAPSIKQKLMLTHFRKLGVALLFLHTNFDFHPQGMNSLLLKIFQPQQIKINDFGCYFQNAQPIKVGAIIDKLKKYCHPQQLIHDSKFSNRFVKKIQILLGSGASMMQTITDNHPIDCYLTGDMKWHDWQLARELDLPVIDLHHSSEQLFNNQIKQVLVQLSLKIELIIVDTQLKLNYQK